MKHFACLALFALWAGAADRTYEVRGKLDPAPGQWGLASLSGAYTPFLADQTVSPDGNFKFKKVAAGTYTLIIGVRGQGSIRQTIEVGPATADKKGRVQVRVAFHPERHPGAAEHRNKVSVQDLAVSAEARREYNKARDLLGQRKHAEAEARLRRATELAPQFAEAWNTLGTLFYQTQRYEEAERAFREALRLHPEAFAPLVNLGGVLINLKRCQEALEYNDRAVRERPNDALANSQLGTSYYCLQKDDQAVRYLEHAKRLDPRHFSNPQILLADIWERRGDLKRAAQELEDFLRARPDTADAAALREYAAKLRAGISPRLMEK